MDHLHPFSMAMSVYRRVCYGIWFEHNIQSFSMRCTMNIVSSAVLESHQSLINFGVSAYNIRMGQPIPYAYCKLMDNMAMKFLSPARYLVNSRDQ